MPNDYNTTIIDTFRANHGDVSSVWQGGPLILVNTTGAKSGKAHTIPLAYLQLDDRVYIVGSGGGSTRHPAWVHNLLANPDVTYELGNGPVEARATLLTGQGREAAWRDIVAALPFFADYETKVQSRKIPVFVLATAS
jgi:deazaflavin-dependent oxidoreductase (nitroreductase family)